MDRSAQEDIRQSPPRNEPQADSRDSRTHVDTEETGLKVEFSPSLRYPELDQYAQQQTLYRIDRERYSLRQSELYTLAEAGKFRAITLENLSRYLYSGNAEVMESDLRHLLRRQLIRLRSVRFEGTIRVVTLTGRGARVVRQAFKGAAPQEIYAGLKKPRELRHDAALYEIYQAKAQEIMETGGKIKRVVLDYELKKKLNREMKNSGSLSPSEQQKLKEEIARKHSVAVVEGRFVVPDVRVEYQDREGNEAGVDLEYLTETYRHGDISSKARAGFHLYAPHDQASRVHRVIDQHHILAEILTI
jgi:hypothetical protein